MSSSGQRWTELTIKLWPWTWCYLFHIVFTLRCARTKATTLLPIITWDLIVSGNMWGRCGDTSIKPLCKITLIAAPIDNLRFEIVFFFINYQLVLDRNTITSLIVSSDAIVGDKARWFVKCLLTRALKTFKLSDGNTTAGNLVHSKVIQYYTPMRNNTKIRLGDGFAGLWTKFN